MAHRVLIFGLPGAGKTWLATRLSQIMPCDWFNADDIRKQFDDWDFSDAGRLRQAERMRKMADDSTQPFAIADFVCPTQELRQVFEAHTSIWLNTIKEGRFEDTNKLFERPDHATLVIEKFYNEDNVQEAAKWLQERAQKEATDV